MSDRLGELISWAANCPEGIIRIGIEDLVKVRSEHDEESKIDKKALAMMAEAFGDVCPLDGCEQMESRDPLIPCAKCIMKHFRERAQKELLATHVAEPCEEHPDCHQCDLLSRRLTETLEELEQTRARRNDGLADIEKKRTQIAVLKAELAEARVIIAGGHWVPPEAEG